MSSKENLTSQEKIDYIYDIIKREQQYKKLQLWMKIFWYVFILFVVFIYIPYYINSKIEKMKESIPSINTLEFSESLKWWVEKAKDVFNNFNF